MTGVTYFCIPYQWGSRDSRSMEFPLILIIHRWQGNTRNSFPHGSFIIWSWLLTFTIHLPTVTTVEELVNMASGKPVQLVYFDENNRLVFDHDVLSTVVESNNLCDTPLALLPIGGAVRSGKSLLISLICSFFQYFASVSVCLLCKHEYTYVCWWRGAYLLCSILFEWIFYLIMQYILLQWISTH